MFHKNGKKGALEEAQKRHGSLLCLFDGRCSGGPCDWAPDVGVSFSNDPSCYSRCPAVSTWLYPGDGPIYYNKQLPLGVLHKSFPLEKQSPPITMLIYQLARERALQEKEDA